MSLIIPFNYLLKVLVVFIIGWNNTMISAKIIEGELITKEVRERVNPSETLSKRIDVFFILFMLL